MLTLSFSFPANKYHATTWAKHVNEGDVEWPPSQWRILRAILSTWFKTANHYGEEDIKSVIEQLAGKPEYLIPRATISHKRHYMPDKSKKKLIFDTFLNFEKDAELLVRFPEANLQKEQVNMLDDILRNINYLGRSESWVNARVCLSEDTEMNVCPVEEISDGNFDTIKLLCVNETGLPELFRKEKGQYVHPLFTYAANLVKKRQAYPENVSFVKYAAPEDRFSNIKRSQTERQRPAVNYAKYLVDSTVLPSSRYAIEVADVARSAAMKLHKDPSPIFSGKDPEGKMLSGHPHAYFLPYDEDGDGRIDHLMIYSREGFDRAHQRSLFDLNRLYGYDLEKELNLMLLGMGGKDDLPDNANSTVLGPSTSWESFTPFLLTRHPKCKRGGEWKTSALEDVQIILPETKGHYSTEENLLHDYGVVPTDRTVIQKDGAVSQLLRELENIDLPRPAAIIPDPGELNSRWIEFKRYRRGKKGPTMSNPYGFKLIFEDKIKGPISLGYASHQGMGMFRIAK